MTKKLSDEACVVLYLFHRDDLRNIYDLDATIANYVSKDASSIAREFEEADFVTHRDVAVSDHDDDDPNEMSNCTVHIELYDFDGIEEHYPEYLLQLHESMVEAIDRGKALA